MYVTEHAPHPAMESILGRQLLNLIVRREIFRELNEDLAVAAIDAAIAARYADLVDMGCQTTAIAVMRAGREEATKDWKAELLKHGRINA